MEKRNYFVELSSLESDIINEIKDELKRLNRNFSREDEVPLEFFNFDCVSDLIEIKSDGTFVYRSGVLSEEFDCDIDGLISNGDLNTSDIIALLNELRNVRVVEEN